MLSCPPMFGQPAFAPTTQRSVRLLHLLFAGLFGLVLPFVCWGAEATPGHPHARAHFVFMTPAQPNAQEVVGAAAQMLAAGVEHVACISAILANANGATGSDLPTGQSVPLVLAITLLMLAALGLLLLPAGVPNGGFARRSPSTAAWSWPLPTTTPPPR